MADEDKNSVAGRPNHASTSTDDFSGKQWDDVSNLKRQPSANVMPGGTVHTAGGQRSDSINVVEAAKLIKWDDWSQLPARPCVKDSLMTGIGAGFAAGGVRAVMRAPIFTACNWAVGSFCFTSFALYQYCTYQRSTEREGMKRAMEIMDRKAIERKQKEQRLERARELRRLRKEEEDKELFERLRAEKEKATAGTAWWKIW